MQVRAGFRVNADPVRARRPESVQVRVDRRDHQVDVEGKGGVRPKRFDHLRTDRDVGHEMAVHDVDVHPVGPRSLDRPHFLAEARKIGRPDGGSDDRRMSHQTLALRA